MLINPPEAADRLCVKPATLEKWRITGRGPAYVKVGRSVKYDPAELKAWIESRTVNSTSEAA